MLIRISKKTTIVCFSVLMSLNNLSYIKKVSLENIVIDNSNGNLVVSLRLENAFCTQMKEFIKNGTPITFTYLFSLFEVRDFWIDKRIVNLKIDHMMKYNVLKKEFVIKRSWQIDEVLITESFDEARRVMTEINNLQIIPFDWLGNDNRYQIGIKAELSKANLPINLRSALSFSPSWGFETDWYILDFRH